MHPHAHFRREDVAGNRKIRCLLVHDHVLLRQGLRRLLEDEADMEVVAEAGNAAEALRKIFEYRPEIVITDAHIFECAADQIEWLILQESADSKVLFLTTHEDDELLAKRAGGIELRGAADFGGRVGGDGEEDARGAEDWCWNDALEGAGEWPPEEMLPRKRVLDGARTRSVEAAGRGQDGAVGGGRFGTQHQDGGRAQVQSDAEAGDSQ